MVLPFMVWRETIHGGCTPFLTGAQDKTRSLRRGTKCHHSCELVCMLIFALVLVLTQAPVGFYNRSSSALAVRVLVLSSLALARSTLQPI